MKKHNKIILLASAAFLVVVAATLGTTLGSGRADSAAVAPTIQSALQAQGLPVASVKQDPVAGTLNVVIQSKAGGSPDDAWANTVVQREAGFLAQSGALAAGTMTVTIVDGQGKTIYQMSGPVDPRLRPAGKKVDPTALDGLKTGLANQAQKQGATLQSVSISADDSQGVVVEAAVTASAAAGDARDAQIKWATLELLGQLRDYADGPGALDVDLYKISIADASGAPLVEYVVDPSAKTVHAWMAPGLTPVWAANRPSPGPVATTAPVSATP